MQYYVAETCNKSGLVICNKLIALCSNINLKCQNVPATNQFVASFPCVQCTQTPFWILTSLQLDPHLKRIDLFIIFQNIVQKQIVRLIFQLLV